MPTLSHPLRLSQTPDCSQARAISLLRLEGLTS